MSASSMKQALSAKEVYELAKWYIESYEDGWRPRIYASKQEQAFYERMHDLYREHVQTP